jgi:uncharacterized damage-inducible protein DinB
MHKLGLFLSVIGLAAMPLRAQDDVKSAILKHLKTSRDFTIKVAEAMPDTSYDFKLTPAQMSFEQQIVHLSQSLTYFLAGFSGEKPNPPKPASTSKADVVAFVKTSFDKAIETVSSLTPEQISKTYKTSEGTMTGLDLLLGMLDHTSHHRASAEMYLRAKGVTPPEYQF